NWEYVRSQMQKHAQYSSTVIPTPMWSDSERKNTNNALIIPEDLLDTFEARLRFESYLNNRQVEQTRRMNCRLFFDLLNRFSNAGLIHYGDSYDKDSVYFLGRECYESLSAHDRLRIFALHQSYLYRLICLKFVELLFESLEIFINTFEQMNLTTKLNHEKNSYNRKATTITIDDIFQKEIIEQIKHDSRYQSLNARETDRHRLIMCHCHFLYDCIYYPSLTINQILKQRRRSFKRRKSSSISLFSNMNVDDNFCPYTRKILSNNNDDNETRITQRFEIGCPMENNCADIRIVNEILSKLKSINNNNNNKNVLICGNDIDVDHFFRIISNEQNNLHINFLTLKNLKFQPIDGYVFVSSNSQEILQDFISEKKIQLSIDHIQTVDLHSQIDGNSISNIPIDIIKTSLEHLLSNEESQNNLQKPVHLRILLCFMCGSETNDVKNFFSQLSSRCSLMINNQSSFMINTFLGRSNRKIEFIPVSFHSLFAMKLIDFDGFILFYDRDRKGALNTMIYLETYISIKLKNESKEKNNPDEKTNETTNICPPIYILSCVKEASLLNTRKSLTETPKTNFCVQCNSGTIKNFIESHLLPFLNQCANGKHENKTQNDRYQTEELLTGVTSYFDSRAGHSSVQDLMARSLEHTHESIIMNSLNNDRMNSLTLISKSNADSPKHHHSSSTPTNPEQIFSYRSYPYLSNSTNGTDSTIVPTTPVDPSIPNFSFVSSTNSISDYQRQYFQKSTSMRFAKLIEHPTNLTNYEPSFNDDHSLLRRKISDVEEIKFHLYKHRTAAHVKVPLATPEIIELNEITPFSIQEYYDASSPKTDSNKNDLIDSSSSIIQSNTVDESVTDSSKQTRVTDSSVDSSSDERLRTTSTPPQNVAVLQRKVSDRKIKRIRAKQNDLACSASSSEVLKKPGSDEDILNDDDQANQKKKRRPSFKRRKKNMYDQAQTDSGIDSRMDSKDSNRAYNTPEPSTNIIISNEEDSSVGDCVKDSKDASIEELEERPTANWIRRQLQHFAQARREKNELKYRSPALTTISSLPPSKTAIATNPSQTHQNTSPFSSLENSYQHVPIRLKLSRCILSNETGIPLFVEKCIQFIEQHGLTIEGLYRISGYKNQVELIINKLNEDPNYDLNLLQVPASAVATAFKDMMRKLDEPILSLEQFDQCQLLTIDQLREQNFIPLQKALLRTSDLKYRTNKYIFKHLHFVSQHTTLTHMDSSNLAVLWWPNLFQPQFHDLRTAEQICQKAKPLIQAIIDNYPIIFNSDQIKEKV
ncbi:unnamed protein product, partial [Rotaria socialis]